MKIAIQGEQGCFHEVQPDSISNRNIEICLMCHFRSDPGFSKEGNEDLRDGNRKCQVGKHALQLQSYPRVGDEVLGEHT
jgi:hypothetical protein